MLKCLPFLTYVIQTRWNVDCSFWKLPAFFYFLSYKSHASLFSARIRGSVGVPSPHLSVRLPLILTSSLSYCNRLFPVLLRQPLPCVLVYSFAASQSFSTELRCIKTNLFTLFPYFKPSMASQNLQGKAKVLSLTFKVFLDLASVYPFSFTSLLPRHKLFMPHR